MIGRSLRRLEDLPLITGQGRYLDDLRMPGMLHAVFVRSPEAHAFVRSIDVDASGGMPGVVGVFLATDLGLERPMPNLFPSPLIRQEVLASPLAVREVCHVGEPVAVVVAETRAQAVDAAEAVFVDYQSLPAITDLAVALDDGAPPAHSGAASNHVGTLEARYGDVEEAFAGGPIVVEVHLVQHRGIAASIETRGVAARPDPGNGVTVWSSTQAPQAIRDRLVEYLSLGPDAVRVVTPDVGGGFGPKAGVYAEEYVVAALARLLGRPVKWVEGRREHFTTTFQQRDQITHLEAAITPGGELLAVRGRAVHDNGAYVPYGLVLPLTGIRLVPGPYLVPALDLRIEVAFTNLTPTSPVRGAGRPYAVFAMERLMDAIARRLDLDPAEARRRNFIPGDRFPYEVPLPSRDGGFIEYDSGDYLAALELALEHARRDTFPARREQDRRRGRLRGMGLASYVEDTGMGPSEPARVEILPGGEVVVDAGAGSQGQGHTTTFAQICATILGIEPGAVVVRSGDTAHTSPAAATVASRTAVTVGASVQVASSALADLVRAVAGRRLEVASEDLVLEQGFARVRGVPGAEIALADLAAWVRDEPEAAGVDGGVLAVDETFDFERPSYAYGTHVAEVSIDPETGVIDVERYVVAHDCGVMINPMIVAGQIDGGVAHGLGNALSERVVFSDEGQPLVTTFMDYKITAAADMPELVQVHTQVPSPRNPLGAKGAGEGGTIPAAAAVAAAVDDALSHLGIVVDRHPITPQEIQARIAAASA